MPNPKDGKLELLNDKNSALVLVDYRPTMFAGVASGDKTNSSGTQRIALQRPHVS
jgi:hypothetical protein